MVWLKIIKLSSQFFPKYIEALQSSIQTYEEFMELFFNQKATSQRVSKKTRVLVVDPSEKNRILIGHYLLAQTQKIQFAKNDVDALDHLQKDKFDLILCPDPLRIQLADEHSKSTQQKNYSVPFQKADILKLVRND